MSSIVSDPSLAAPVSGSRGAGSLAEPAWRIDLAQYRELEAFAKFGSDLDKSTQQLLRRGQRLVELLKQAQYSPMPVEEQVVSIFAGTNGFIDAIPIEQVRRFELGLLEAMRLRNTDLLAAIADKKELTPEITEQLKKVIGDYAATFK